MEALKGPEILFASPQLKQLGFTTWHDMTFTCERFRAKHSMWRHCKFCYGSSEVIQGPVNMSSVVELSTRETLLLQLNGILLKWKIQQISQNAATEAAKRPFSHAQLKCFHPGQPGWSVHKSPVNRDPCRRDRDLGWPGWPGSHMNTSEVLQRK